MLLDAYERKARLAPGLLAATPLALPLLTFGLIETGVAVGAEGVFAFALSNLARRRGKELEPRLWQAWGGPPTCSALRHASATNSELLRRAHSGAETLTGISMPSPDEEQSDPAAADERYDAAAQIAIERFRSSEGGYLIRQESATYGYQRNLFGLRPLGIGFSVTGVVVTSGLVLSSLRWQTPPSVVLVAIILLLEGLLLWFWVSQVKEERVQEAGMGLARAVLNALAAGAAATS